MQSAYFKTHLPCLFISSYIVSGARSISPGQTTTPYSMWALPNSAGSRRQEKEDAAQGQPLESYPYQYPYLRVLPLLCLPSFVLLPIIILFIITFISYYYLLIGSLIHFVTPLIYSMIQFARFFCPSPSPRPSPVTREREKRAPL